MKTELLALIDELVKFEIYVTEGQISAAKDAKRVRANIVFLLANATHADALDAPAVPAKLPQEEGADWFLVLDPEEGIVHFSYTADLGRSFGHEHIKDAQHNGEEHASRWVVRPAYAHPSPDNKAPADVPFALTRCDSDASLLIKKPIFDEQIALENWRSMQPYQGATARLEKAFRDGFRAAGAPVAVELASVFEAWHQSAADTAHQTGGAGPDYNQGVVEGVRICARDLRAAMAAQAAQKEKE